MVSMGEDVAIFNRGHRPPGTGRNSVVERLVGGHSEKKLMPVL